MIVAGGGPRAVVTTASYEARRYGVGSAMPAARARRRVPHAVFLAPDFPSLSRGVAANDEFVRSHVEQVEVVGLDEAYLDLGDLYSPRAAMRRLVTEIRQTLQLTCSVGIGPNKLVAKVASDAEKPAGFVVLSRELACARFASSPPTLVPGIGPKTAARLADAGTEDPCGGGLGSRASARPAFRAQPRAGIGEASAVRTRRQGGELPARWSPSRASVPSNVTSRTRGSCEQRSRRWRASSARASATHRRRGRTIAIKVRLDDFTTVTRAHTVPEPTCDAGLVTEVALRLLEEYSPPRPVRAARSARGRPRLE